MHRLLCWYRSFFSPDQHHYKQHLKTHNRRWETETATAKQRARSGANSRKNGFPKLTFPINFNSLRGPSKLLFLFWYKTWTVLSSMGTGVKYNNVKCYLFPLKTYARTCTICGRKHKMWRSALLYSALVHIWLISARWVHFGVQLSVEITCISIF